MITPFVGRPDKVPLPPTCLDLETDGTRVIAIGFAWYDGAVHYAAYPGFDEWFMDYKRLYKTLADRRLRAHFRRIYAHNGAGFDWLFLHNWADESNKIKSFEMIYSQSFAIGMDFKLPGIDAIIHLRDSLRLLPAPLSELTATFGVAAPKLEIDTLPHRLLIEDSLQFWRYLEHDVKGLQQTLFAFWQSIFDLDGSIDELPMTIASLALRLWRKTLKRPIYTTWNPHLEAFERAAYTGGRVDCFRVGSGEAHVYDVNSLYPSVMRGNPYPLTYEGYWTTLYDPAVLGIYEVDYVQPVSALPPLLRDHETGEYAYFGHGTYPSPELNRLRQLGGSFVVCDGYVYEETGSLFTEFVDRWWPRRRAAQMAGDDALSYVAKIVMNSVYGKLGQRKTREVIRKLDIDEIEAHEAAGDFLDMIGGYTVLEEEIDTPYAFPAVAAFVTSYARVAMHRYYAEAIARGGELWYTDTDSIHTTAILATSPELGELKEKYFGYATYAAKKLYALHDISQVICSGAPAHERRWVDGKLVDVVLIAPDDLAALVNRNRTKTIESWRFPSFREVLAGVREPGEQVSRKLTIGAPHWRDG